MLDVFDWMTRLAASSGSSNEERGTGTAWSSLLLLPHALLPQPQNLVARIES
jgi:hypothetical protein